MLLGSLAATLIGYISTLDGMPTWSWRAAFMLGGFVGIGTIFYRKNLEESPNFQKADPKHHGIKELIKTHPLQLLAGMFLGGFATVPFTTVLIFINPVLMTKNVFSASTLMLVQSFIIVVEIFALVLSGRMADKKSPQKVMNFAALSLTFLSFPLLLVIDGGPFYWVIAAQTVLIIINAILLGPSNAYYKNVFPMHYRYRGASLSFTLGLSIFGGLTPIVENYLYLLTGNFCGITPWLAFIGIGTYITVKLASTQIARTALRL